MGPAIALALALATAPDTAIVQSGRLELRGLLWRPEGEGPFPAVLFNHGSGHGVRSASEDRDEHTMEWQADQIGPVFARHGYLFLYLFRRGTGLSSNLGPNSSDLWERATVTQGQEARNKLQLRLMETVELNDAFAGLRFLRKLRDVDKSRVAVAGHSFGGSLTLLMTERDSSLRAAIVFSGSARSWPQSAELRRRLTAAVGRTVVPTFFIAAANDYSVAPAESLSAEMDRLARPYKLKIYPPVGKTPQEGHSFVHLRVATWEPDVFAFLDPLMR